MKRQIRYGVFETNSSSVHSLMVCTKEEFVKFKNGELYFDGWGDQFIDPQVAHAKYTDAEMKDEEIFKDYKEWIDSKDWFDTFLQNYTSPSGDELVMFGYYGHD